MWAAIAVLIVSVLIQYALQPKTPQPQAAELKDFDAPTADEGRPVPVVFGSSDPNSDLFKRGAEWAGVCYAVKDAVTFVAAFALMAAARKLDRRRIHGVCLALGGLGLLAVGFIHGEEHHTHPLAAQSVRSL